MGGAAIDLEKLENVLQAAILAIDARNARLDDLIKRLEAVQA